MVAHPANKHKPTFAFKLADHYALVPGRGPSGLLVWAGMNCDYFAIDSSRDYGQSTSQSLGSQQSVNWPLGKPQVNVN